MLLSHKFTIAGEVGTIVCTRRRERGARARSREQAEEVRGLLHREALDADTAWCDQRQTVQPLRLEQHFLSNLRPSDGGSNSLEILISRASPW